MTPRGSIEGWIAFTEKTVGFVKGCFQPLPLLYYVPRLVKGVKTWSPSMHIHGDPALVVAEDPCLGGRRLLLDPRRARLLNPVEAKRRLRGCETRVCRAARLLLEYLEAAVSNDVVGVTGGLAYNTRGASDVDVVVYGSAAHEAYKVLQELRRLGVTTPFTGIGHGWSNNDAELGEKLSSSRVLFGYIEGVEYNVRLVACEEPARCYRVRVLGRARVRARLCGGIGYTTPAVYTLCGTSKARLLMSFRLRYTELPSHALIEAEGVLEEHCGMKVLVPDHGGWIRLLG